MKFYNIRSTALKKYSIFERIKPLYRFLPGPLFVLVHITLKCDKTCWGCYQILDSFYATKREHMPLEDFTKILVELKKMEWFKPHLHIIGGEPLVHPEFNAVMQNCSHYGVSFTMTTNGYRIKEHCESILASSVSEMNISIPVDKKGDIQGNFLEGLQYFIKIRERKRTKRPILNLNYLITKDSYLFLEKTINFFKDNFAKNTFETFTCEHLEFERKDPDKLQLNTININLLCKQIKRIREMKGGIRIYYAPSIRLQDIKLYYQSDYLFRHSCFIPWVGLNVYPDLSVTPGGAIFGCNEIVGSLKNQTMQDIWFGPSLNKLHKNITEKGLPENCFRCCHMIYY